MEIRGDGIEVPPVPGSAVYGGQLGPIEAGR